MPFQTNKQFQMRKDSDFKYLVSVIDFRINFLMTLDSNLLTSAPIIALYSHSNIPTSTYE